MQDFGTFGAVILTEKSLKFSGKYVSHWHCLTQIPNELD